MQLTATVKSKTQDNAFRVDVVSPQELQALVNLSKVGMCKGMRAKRFDILIPNTVYCRISDDLIKVLGMVVLRISYVMILNQSRYFSILTMSKPFRYQ
jgi:hypothetical protein